MNKIFLIFTCAITIIQVSIAQKNLPVIRATSDQASIWEGGEISPWWLDPSARPDVHVITKCPNAKRVVFRTDIDSLVVRLRPGEQADFVVLLNGRDSCYTRIKSEPVIHRFARQTKPTHDTIPFVLTEYNNLKIKAVLNGVDTLDLKFDSGATGLLITREAIKQKTSLLKQQPADGSRPKLPPYNTLQLGNLTWDSLSVYPVELSGQGTDGRFGWDLFDGRVVEIDYDRSLFIVHSRMPKMPKGFTKMPMEYSHHLFCIRGELINHGKVYKNRFLFDNGYQRTIMLDSTLNARQQFPNDLKVIKTTIMKNGQGKEFPVVTVNNEILKIGKTKLPDIPAQKLNSVNPTGFPIHILGNEVLKRFNTILDFYDNYVYIKPNHLVGAPYAESH